MIRAGSGGLLMLLKIDALNELLIMLYRCRKEKLEVKIN
jgi:hypothetical protein